MKMELTAKDIKLLKVMLTLLIAVLMIRFLIFPAVEQHQTLQFEYEEAERKKEEMQYRIDNIQTTLAVVEKTKKNLAELSKPYYNLLEQREIDEIVTGLAYKHGLFPSRLNIGERTDELLAPYLYSREAKEVQKAAEAAEKKAGTDKADKDIGQQEQHFIQSAEATILLLGSNENILALLQDIETNYPSIHVRSFQSGRTSYMNTDLHLTEETKTSLALTMLMCEK